MPFTWHSVHNLRGKGSVTGDELPNGQQELRERYEGGHALARNCSR
jgi:hypothetical protein